MILLTLTLVLAYALSITALLALQNRSPRSTFAWVLFFVLFPPGALLVYVMFGRGRHAFSREQTTAKLLEGSTLADRAARVVAAQPAAIANPLRLRASDGGRLSIGREVSTCSKFEKNVLTTSRQSET